MDRPLTVAYFTCRREPRFEWFARSLDRELAGRWDALRLLIVDYWMRGDTAERAARADAFRRHWAPFAAPPTVRHVAPKPTPWQGEHRRTNAREYFAASNARNTAFALCATDYIVCADDLSVLREGWLQAVLWGRARGAVVLGCYAKVRDLSCAPDGAYAFDPASLAPGLDSRYAQFAAGRAEPHEAVALAAPPPTASDDARLEPQRVAGSWLFGCSFGLPLELALAIDGFDEACDGQGGEDTDAGVRLGRVAPEVFYCRRMMTLEDDDLHAPGPGDVAFARLAKMVTPAGRMPERAGIMSDHAILQRVMAAADAAPFLPSRLREQRAGPTGENAFSPVETDPTDWRDGARLRDM